MQSSESIKSCLDSLETPVSDISEIEKTTCIHQCEGSCNNEIIDCYPLSSCLLNCTGDNSCNNVTVKFEDIIDVDCDGSNSCKKMKFRHEPLIKNSKFLLPYIKIPNRMKKETAAEIEMEFGEYYILAKHASPSNILNDIEVSKSDCIKSNHHRQWYRYINNMYDYATNSYGSLGNDTEMILKKDILSGVTFKGQNVFNIDNCLLDSVYLHYKYLLWNMLEEKRISIINNSFMDIIYDDDLVNNTHNIYIDEIGYHYLWDEHIINYQQLEPRVVEYIMYETMSTGEWHIDEQSSVTMAIMLTNRSEYEGGYTEMKYHENDKNNEIIGYDRGDVILFDSLTEHQVQPVLNGSRNVLVVEFWTLGRSYRDLRVSPNEQKFDRKCVQKCIHNYKYNPQIQKSECEFCWTETYDERMLRQLKNIKLPINIDKFEKNETQLSINIIHEVLYFIPNLIDTFCKNKRFVTQCTADETHKSYGFLINDTYTTINNSQANYGLQYVKYHSFEWYSLLINHSYHCINIDPRRRNIWNQAIRFILQNNILKHSSYIAAKSNLHQYLMHIVKILTHHNSEFLNIWLRMQFL